MYVATNMSAMQPALFTPAPDDYVRSVLKKVGVTLKCFGYWPHELQASKIFHVFVFIYILTKHTPKRSIYFSGKHSCI